MVWTPPIQIESIGITPELVKRIAEVDEFKGAWRAIGRLAPDRLHALRRVATIESIGSSTRIEGSRLSDAAVETLLKGLRVQPLKTRDEEEVVGYSDAMEMVLDNWRHITLTENHIKQLHGTLLYHASKDQHHRGNYKTHPNSVEAFAPDGQSLGTVFETATPFETPSLMESLVTWARTQLDEQDENHPLVVIGLFIVVFLAIHPFEDGNGRMSRILTTLLLLRAGYEYVPFDSLESVIEQNKEDYYLALRRTQQTLDAPSPDWLPWFGFFLRALAAQKDHLARKIETEHLLMAGLPKLSLKILELCNEQGRVTVAEVEQSTGAKRGTIKDHLRSLTKANHLVRHGAGRGTWYGIT